MHRRALIASAFATPFLYCGVTFSANATCKMIAFRSLWDAYPTEKRPELFKTLGGQWPKLVENEAYRNTCALRLSLAMIQLGMEPPVNLQKQDGGHQTGKGKRLILRAATALQWMESICGRSTWGISKSVGAGIEGLVPKWNGILLYHVPGSSDGSTGHVDLWDASQCRMDCHSDYALGATRVEMWRLD